MLLLKKCPAVVLVGPNFFPALKWILGAPMKACSTVDNGGGMEGIFQILGTNLSVLRYASDVLVPFTQAKRDKVAKNQ